MRALLIAFGCLLATVAGFVATLWLLDGVRQPAEPTAAADLEIGFKAGMLAPAAAGTVTPGRHGLAIAWKAASERPKSPLDGVFMHTLSAEQLPSLSNRQLAIEVEVTADAWDSPLTMEVQFIQNGLKMSGWHQFALRAGRQRHVLRYQAPFDTRTKERLSTIWLRPDVEGRGRPVIVHAVRLYLL
jgi:hypothetical protein